MSQYRHGAYVEERATSLVTPVTAESALPVIVGTAPVHRLPEGTAAPVNEPRLIYSLPEFVAQFGAPAAGDNKADFTLYQAAEVYLTRYKVAPLVAINVFDPAKHCRPATPGDAVASGSKRIAQSAAGSGLAGPDGSADGAGDVEAPAVPDVGMVKEADIIGGVDADSLQRTGLALVEEIFPRFRLTPGQVLAPRWSGDPTVALAIGAACKDICGHFRSLGIIEVPDEVTRYTDAPAWLNDNNLTDPNLLCMYGHGLYGDALEYGSIHLAGAIGGRDASTEGIPYWSPSNNKLECEGIVHAGKALHLGPSQAAYLNGQGIVTGLNIIGGLKAWGDQTTAYPGVTDVKDSSIPIRRMFSWVGNTLVLTSWQYVSNPVRRRMVETVQDTFDIWLNGLAGREYILGGRVTFELADNPTTDLMSGKVRWHVYLCPPQAGRELIFILEYDPSYLSTLF